MPELRETIDLETPVTKRKLVIRGYATGRIRDELEQVALSNAKVTASASDAGSLVMDGASATIAARHRAVELMVISVDGSTENVLDKVLDLPADDYDFVKSQIDEATAPLVKTTSTGSTTGTTGS